MNLQNKIKILSADLQIFNDETFRYYLPQFICFCIVSFKFIIKDYFYTGFLKLKFT